MSQQYPQDPNQPRFDVAGFPIKPKGKHTARNILLAVVGVFVILIVIGALAGSPPEDAADQPAATGTPDTGPSPDPITTPTNKPVPTPTSAPAVTCADQEDRNAPCVVKAGKPFQLGKHTVLTGWKVSSEYGSMSITGKAKNTGDAASAMFVDVKFLRGDEVLASVMCTTDSLEPGQTKAISCFSSDDYTKKYDRITAEATF
jgi:hypothetical protein